MLACPVQRTNTGGWHAQDTDKPNQLTRNAAQNIVNVNWQMPADVQVSQNCMAVLNSIFVKDPKVGPWLNMA